MRYALLVFSAVLLIAAPASAMTVQQRLEKEAAMAVNFWAARDVGGCPQGVAVHLTDSFTAGQGGFCNVYISAYWLPPNVWGMTRDEECAMVFHEVRHALDGGTFGGVDGEGHTATGLMAVPIDGFPMECRRWARASRRGPPKGVRR